MSPERPRLLFVVTEDWYFVSHRLGLAVAASEAGFHVAVATRVSKYGDMIRTAGLQVIELELERRGGNPFAEIRRLIALYRGMHPTLVHHVALKPVLYGSLAARIAGVKQVVNAIAGFGWLFASGRIAARLSRPFVRALLARLLDAPGYRTIVQNPSDADLLRSAGVASERLRLIRGAGVDTKRFVPVRAPAGPITVMLAARMLWDKGVREFVEAAQSLQSAGLNARFVLVGAPDRANPASVPVTTLRKWQAREGVEWWGQSDDMPATFAAAHIVCLPSYHEGLPKVLLEAAACGRPIVASDIPGCREIVQHERNGLLVPVADAKALAAAIARLAQDAGLRDRMGEWGRELAVRDFAEERVIAQTLALYRELVPGAEPREETYPKQPGQVHGS